MTKNNVCRYAGQGRENQISFFGCKKSLFAMERENFHSLCVQHDLVWLLSFSSAQVVPAGRMTEVLRSTVASLQSVFLKHGNGPALLAWQRCEGQSMLYWKEASSLLHWLTEIPGRILSKGLFENR